jgi:hypothetical protein
MAPRSARGPSRSMDPKNHGAFPWSNFHMIMKPTWWLTYPPWKIWKSDWIIIPTIGDSIWFSSWFPFRFPSGLPGPPPSLSRGPIPRPSPEKSLELGIWNLGYETYGEYVWICIISVIMYEYSEYVWC